MKTNKSFDGDKIYALAVTLFAGICSVGVLVTAAVMNIF